MTKIIRPGRVECVRAKCFECTNQFADGRVDCEHQDCPLYVRIPYRKLPPRIGWLTNGAWSKKYQNKIQSLDITIVEYVKKYMMPKGKLKIPIPDIMRAKCFRCQADYYQGGKEPGKVECGLRSCPLYPYTPYHKQEPDLDWLFHSKHTSAHRNYLLMHPSVTKEQYIQMIFGE